MAIIQIAGVSDIMKKFVFFKEWLSHVNIPRYSDLFYGVHVDGNVSTHMFRKTLGNRVLKLNNYSNQSIVLLMELFGHSSMGITKRYLGIREKEVMGVYESLSL